LELKKPAIPEREELLIRHSIAESVDELKALRAKEQRMMEARRNFLRRFCFFLFHSSLTCVVCAVFLFLASRLILSHWRSVERAQRNIAKVVDPVQSVLGMQIRFASAIVGY